ncbi:MAG: glycerophosphodiester phosphodiesterase family protein, partial [Anaerotignaceae bacterium]
GLFYKPKENIKLKKIILLLMIVILNCNVVFGQSIENMDMVLHAGGVIGEDIGTNSMESLKNAFTYGYRYIELDFNFTTDNHLVAIHDWETNYFGKDYNFNGKTTLEEFKKLKINGKYTPITMENLVPWLNSMGHVYIITDIKDNNIQGLSYIKEKYPYIMNKIVPQIYKEAEYNKVREMGYENIIYTLYALPYGDKINTNRIVNFAKNNKLLAITFSTELITEKYVSELKNSSTKLFCHTVNKKEEAEKYKAMGLGVYTDLYLN